MKTPKKKDGHAPCRPHYGRAIVARVLELGDLDWTLEAISKEVMREHGVELSFGTIALWIKYGVTRVRERGREEDVRR